MPEDSSALCAAHSAPAIGPCERCGTFVCDQCGLRVREHLRCYACGPPAAEKPPGLPFAALIVASLGMMCPPASLAGIAMVVIWRLTAKVRPQMGLQYARWAVAVALLSLAAGGAIWWWTASVVLAVQKDVAAGVTSGGRE